MKQINIFFRNFLLSLSLLIGIFGLLGSFNLNTNAQTLNDLNILGVECIFPGQPNCEGETTIFDLVVNFGLALAPVMAVLVIMWGGYKYFFGGLGIEDQANAIKTIRAGGIGLVVVLIANPVVQIFRSAIGEGENGEVALNSDALIQPINAASTFLFLIVGAVAVLVIMWGGYKYLFSGLPGEQEDGIKTIRAGVTGLVVVLVARPLSALLEATVTGSQDGGEEASSLAFNTDGIVGTLGVIISQFLIPLSSVVTVFFFVLGAYYLITARGQEEQVTAGRKAITNAVIGLVIVLLATTAVQLIIFFIPTETPAPSQETTTTFLEILSKYLA
jgi:hypothetical protein